jgi:membrane-bound metal-dependent hydrolase YbcI (DUF457 family)
MDPVTHGITGALLGKACFSERQGRVATFAATLGALFPDVDIVGELFSRDPLALIKDHRGITHSFVALPFFAALLGWLTRKAARRLGIESPSASMLTLIYAVGIASHILLDAMTSFGTRIWDPISKQRIAWDLLFIVDFTFASIVLVPQVVAWIYRDRGKNLSRATVMWVLFSLSAFVVWVLAHVAGFPFHFWIMGVVSAVMAVLFFLPMVRGWGFQVRRAAWCQAGIFAAVTYIFLCAIGHHAAMTQVKVFANANHIVVDRMGAIPIPPSMLDWGIAIRSADGVYKARYDLRDMKPPVFQFIADSPPDQFTARAMQFADVRLYWQFARFPLIRTSVEDGHHIVEFSENRFAIRRQDAPQPFTYRLVFDDKANLIEQGWRSNGLLMRRLRPEPPRRSADTP